MTLNIIALREACETVEAYEYIRMRTIQTAIERYIEIAKLDFELEKSSLITALGKASLFLSEVMESAENYAQISEKITSTFEIIEDALAPYQQQGGEDGAQLSPGVRPGDRNGLGNSMRVLQGADEDENRA